MRSWKSWASILIYLFIIYIYLLYFHIFKIKTLEINWFFLSSPSFALFCFSHLLLIVCFSLIFLHQHFDLFSFFSKGRFQFCPRRNCWSWVGRQVGARLTRRSTHEMIFLFTRMWTMRILVFQGSQSESLLRAPWGCRRVVEPQQFDRKWKATQKERAEKHEAASNV